MERMGTMSGPRHAAARPAVVALAAALCLLSGPEAGAQSAKRWTCLLPGTGELRLIDLEYATDGPVPCAAFDRQPGGVKRVANYNGTPGKCESTVDSIIANLGRAGYQCSGPVDPAAAPASAEEPDAPTPAPNQPVPPEPATAPEATAPEPRAPRPRAEPDAATGPPVAAEAPAGPPPQDTQPSEPAEPPVLPASVDKTDQAAHVLKKPPGGPAGEGAYFAIASTHVVADLAQQAVAEIRRRDPSRQATVFPPRPDAAYWSVAVAAYSSRAEAERMVALASAEGLGRLPFLWTFPNPPPADRRAWVASPDEWQSALIGGCRAEGADTMRAMAECSGLIVPPETFASCMAGSVCAPEALPADGIAAIEDQALPALQEIDRAPYVEPMLATTADARACIAAAARDPATRTTAFGACMAAAMMSPGQRAVHDCFDTASAPAGRAACIAGAAPEEEIVAACLAAGTDDPYTFVSCAGGRLAGRELARCASLGDGPVDCFGAHGMLAPALREIAHDVGLLPAAGSDGLREALEAVATHLEQGSSEPGALRRTLGSLGNQLRQMAGVDGPVLAAFDTIAPRWAGQ